MVYLILIVEDLLSEAVATKIIEKTERNFEIVNTLSWNKDEIKGRINDINNAARNQVYFVLTDQDTNDRCPPNAIKELPGQVHSNLLYRFAVMEIESWVMAHREAISEFLSVPLNRIPNNTDSIEQPKEYLVNMARISKSSRIKRDIAPRYNSTSKVGPDYNGRLIEFVSEYWNVRTAAQSSPSLKRTFERLINFSETPSVS